MMAWDDDYPRTRVGDTSWRDWLPIAIIAVACFVVVFTGWHV